MGTEVEVDGGWWRWSGGRRKRGRGETPRCRERYGDGLEWLKGGEVDRLTGLKVCPVNWSVEQVSSQR